MPSKWSSTGRPVLTLASPPPSTASRTRSCPSGWSSAYAIAPLPLDTLDPGAERAQPFVDALVAPVDPADVRNRRSPFGAERCDQHRPARANVGALHPLAVELGRTCDDDPVRIAQDHARAHVDQLVDEEEPAFEHLLEDQNRAPGLSRDDQRDRGHVGREQRPRPVLDLRDLTPEIVLDRKLLLRWNAHARLTDLDPDAEPLQPGKDRDQIRGPHLLDRHVAARDGGAADEAPDFDVVGADAPLAASELTDTLDPQLVRADAADSSAARVEEAAQVLHVRLARGIRDHRLAAGKRGGHDRVLGARHARLVEVHRGPGEPVRAHVEPALEVDLRAELGERVDVDVEPPTADRIASGQR